MKNKRPEPPTNPFSSCWVRPDANAYQFPEGNELRNWLAVLDQLGGVAQIVGPHGSGKSTLVASLRRQLPESPVVRQRVLQNPTGRPKTIAAGRDEAQDGMLSWWNLWRQRDPVGTLWIVDGIEQMSRPQRAWLRWLLKRRGCRLLVTTHRDLGWPILWTCSVSPELAWQVVRLRLQGHPETAGFVQRQDVVDLLQHHDGNLRDTQFDLYDRWEAWVRRKSASR